MRKQSLDYKVMNQMEGQVSKKFAKEKPKKLTNT